jgi:hypothetical protein
MTTASTSVPVPKPELAREQESALGRGGRALRCGAATIVMATVAGLSRACDPATRAGRRQPGRAEGR